MERLAHQVQQTQQVLATGDAEWGAVADALEALADEVEVLASSHGPTREAVKLLQSLSSELGAQITGYRSKLVGHVCRSMTRIVRATQRDFRDLANDLLPALVNTAKGASGAVRAPGAELFRVVSQHVRFDLPLFRKIFVQSPQEKIRVLMLEQVAVILACWQKEEVEPHEGDVLEVVRRGLLDPAQSVRSASRDAICAFAAIWEERADELVAILSPPAQELLLKDKPHAVISLAISKKHPEMLKKAAKVTATASAASKKIARHRSLVKMSSPTDDQTVEIHVATPPEKQPLAALRDTSEEHTLRQAQAPLPRRLFQDGDKDEVTSSQAKKSAAQPPTSLKAETSIHKPTEGSSTSIPAPPTASRSDDSFRRSRLLEGSRIPLPPSRSPTLQTTAQPPPRVFGSSRLQDISPLEQQPSPSLIPRRAGSTSALPTSFKPSLVRRASHDSHHPVSKETTSVNARDHFLDHPIPSSAPSPIAVRSESNVTVRARRRPLQTATVAETPAPPSKVEDLNVHAAEQPPHVEASLPVIDPSPTGTSPNRQLEEEAQFTVSSPQYDETSLMEEEGKYAVAMGEEIQGLMDLELSAITEEEPRPPTTSWAFEIASGVAIDGEEKLQSSTEEVMQWADEQQAVVAGDDFAESESILPAKDVIESGKDPLNAFGDAPEEEDLLHGAVDAFSSDSDIKEAMLTSSDAMVQDHFEIPNEASEGVRRDEKEGENLPRDALANLIDIQKTMATLQALTKVDVRGVPLKPRLSMVVESPVARPRSAGRVTTHSKQRLLQPRSQDDLFDSKPHATRESAGKQFEYVARVVTESKTSSRSQNGEESLAVEAHDDQSMVVRGEDFQYLRGFRVPNGKPQHRVASEHTRVQSEQSDNVPQRRRRAVARSTDIDWVQVERQFQGIVRESEARQQSQTSSADLTGSKQEVSDAAVQQTRENGTNTGIATSDTAPQVLEPPIQMTVNPAAATAVSRRNVFTGHHIETARLQADLEPGYAQHSTLDDSVSQSERSNFKGERRYSWPVAYARYFFVVLVFIFGATGLLRAATTLRDTHDYHQALKTQITLFEASISESYASVRKLEENYAVWSEYVRLLAEEDETHSLSLLETIQHEVERWQQEMRSDLAEFKKSLSVDVVEAALAPLLQNATIPSES